MFRQPTDDDPGAWIYYWRKVGQAWRREPEIGAERQTYLSYLIDAPGDLAAGKRFPFERIILHRGDIEWLVTRYAGRHLDLRGAILRRHDLLGIEPAALAMLILDDTTHTTKSKHSQELMNDPTHMKAGDSLRGQLIPQEYDASEERYGSMLKEGDSKAQDLLDAYESGERDFTGWDLAGASLKTASLRDVNLAGAILRGADLSYSDLSGATLEGADLSGADLSFATLIMANMSHAKLCSAVMRGSNLTGVNFQRADLSNAHMQRSRWENANFAAAIQTGVVWGDPLPAPRSFWDEPARPISSEDYIGEWWSRNRDS